MIFRILTICLFLFALSFAQFVDRAVVDLETNRVVKITLEGVIFIDEASVRSRLSVKEGGSYQPAVLADLVQSSVESIYESGFFDDVKVFAEYKDKPGEVELIFSLKELPALDTLIISGNDDLTESDLRLKTHLMSGEVYSKSALERDRQSVLAHYRSEGYLLAEVWIREIPVDDNKNKVIFSISEGNKVKVDSILISGNDNVPTQEILNRKLTKTESWWGGGDFKKELFAADRDTVLGVARHHGYLDAELTEYTADYLPDSTCRFYLGRTATRSSNLNVVYSQMNSAVSDVQNPLHVLAGKSIAISSHHYIAHRAKMGDRQAFPVPVISDEKQVTNILNNIITYSELRKEWNKTLKGKSWNNPRIDSLLAIKKRTAYEDRLLARYSIEEALPALMPYDSVNTASYVQIKIGMKEGRKYYAGSVNFSGNEILPVEFLQAQVRLDSGNVFDYDAYEATKKSIMDAYRESGYLFVQLDERKNYVNDSVVNLSFSIREGLPAQIHKVHIRGNTRTKDNVIRREIRLFPGDTYRQSLLERSFRDVMQLNYFDNVMPDIQVVGDQDIDLVFNVSEREAGTGQFGAGVAYSQADGLIFTLNLSIPNCCMGDGQSANISAEYGEDKRSVAFGFSEPWLFDTPTKVGFSANYTWWRGYDDYYNPDITRYGGSVYIGRRLTWPDDYFYAQVGLGWQENKQGDNVEGSLVKYTGTETSINFTLIRDDRNLPIFPTDGSRYVASVLWAVPFNKEDYFDFIQTDLSIKWWFPMLSDKLSLGIINEFGFITGNSLQYRSLYQMGGSLGYQGLMRGYRAGSIGAYRLGRSYQYSAAELIMPVAPNRFYLLPLFFDAGNVFGKQYSYNDVVSKKQGSPLRDWDISSLKRDLGFGFRVIVPMLGIIGFDFAWPLDPGETGGFDAPSVGNMEFNFMISQGF